MLAPAVPSFKELTYAKWHDMVYKTCIKHTDLIYCKYDHILEGCHYNWYKFPTCGVSYIIDVQLWITAHLVSQESH